MNRITVEGAELAYEDTGAPSGGVTSGRAPVVLLVHGFPLSHAMWQAQVAGLADSCRVVAPDLRGFGESSLGGWPAAGEPATLDRYADDLVALLDVVEPTGSVTIVGFSMGGYVALNLLRRHADRFDRLALVDTRAGADTDAARETRLKMADGVAEWGAGRVAALMRPNLFAPGTDDAIVEATVRVISATAPEAIAAAQRAMAARPDATPLLPTIAKPTLVLVGEDDAITPPSEAREMAGAIPGARLEVVPRAGHMTPVERPTAVTAALGALATD